MSISENETQKVKNILQVFSKMPKVYRWISIIAVLVALGSVALGLSSCGTTRAVVHNGASGSVTEIKITTNNPTSVQASPNVQIPVTPGNYGKKNETEEEYP